MNTLFSHPRARDRHAPITSLRPRRVRLLLATLMYLAASSSFAQDEEEELFGIPEIPHPGIADIAVASFQPGIGPVIFYNPAVVAQAHPALVQFIRAHEYAHHRLEHISQMMFNANPWTALQLARENEMEADDWATRFWAARDPGVVQATIAVMRSPSGGNFGDLTHLPTPVRADRIERLLDEIQNSSSPDNDEDDGDTFDPVAETELVAGLLIDGEFDEIYDRFSQSLQMQLGPPQLAQAMNTMVAQVGYLNDVGSARVRDQGGQTTGEVMCSAEEGRMLVRVVFDRHHEIVGLWVFPR